MDDSRGTLRLKLEGRWSADDFGHALCSLSGLYDLRLFLELLREEVREWERYYPDFLEFPISIRHRLGRRPYPPRLPYWPGPPTLDETFLSRLPQLIAPEERLVVTRVKYSSPGFTDLTGAGAIVGHLKDFVLKLIERNDNKPSRKLSEERQKLENDRLRIENARNLVTLGRDLGYSEIEMRALVRLVDDKQDILDSLVSQEMLVGASVRDPDKE